MRRETFVQVGRRKYDGQRTCVMGFTGRSRVRSYPDLDLVIPDTMIVSVLRQP